MKRADFLWFCKARKTISYFTPPVNFISSHKKKKKQQSNKTLAYNAKCVIFKYYKLFTQSDMSWKLLNWNVMVKSKILKK